MKPRNASHLIPFSPSRRALLGASAAAIAAPLALRAQAQGDSAAIPVPQQSRILVGFGAGGSIDVLARVLAERIGPLWAKAAACWWRTGLVRMGNSRPANCSGRPPTVPPGC